MQSKAVIITINGQFIETEFTGPIGEMISKHFPDGFEIFRPKRLSPEYCMVVDDMGHAKRLNINLVGSYLYCSDEHGNYIVGDIIFLRITGPHVFGLSKDDIQYLKNEYSTMAEVGYRLLNQKRLEIQNSETEAGAK